MRRSKVAVRKVGGVDAPGAVEVLRRHGFDEHDEVPDGVVLKKPGTQLTLQAHRFPLEATVSVEGEGDALELSLRYDTFVLFDQGDLESEADRLSRALSRGA